MICRQMFKNLARLKIQMMLLAINMFVSFISYYSPATTFQTINAQLRTNGHRGD